MIQWQKWKKTIYVSLFLLALLIFGSTNLNALLLKQDVIGNCFLNRKFAKCAKNKKKRNKKDHRCVFFLVRKLLFIESHDPYDRGTLYHKSYYNKFDLLIARDRFISLKQ